MKIIECNLWQNIHYYITLRDISLNELDRRMGKSEGYLSRLLSNKAYPRTDSLIILAYCLDITIEELIGNTILKGK